MGAAQTENAMKPTRPAKVYRDAAFLSLCDATDAREWLRARPVKYSTITGTPDTPDDSHILEYVLYRRNLPLIDLALAEHGRSGLVLARVYYRASAATRVAACANPSLFCGSTTLGSIGFRDRNLELLWDIVREGPPAELRAVCECPDLPSTFYAELVTSWRRLSHSQAMPENRLPDDRFKCVLRYLAGNPRISIPREHSRERHYLDGFANFQYNNLFFKCWRFAEIVPIEREWAELLAPLYRNLHRPGDIFDDVEQVLQRWRPEDEHLAAAAAELREEIAVKFLTPRIEMPESEDPAIRRAFYRSFDPDLAEFEALSWFKWLERDEFCYLELLQNEKIWRSPGGRARLRLLLSRDASRNDDMTRVGFFKERVEGYRKTNPEWFSDEDAQTEIGPEEPEPDRFAGIEQALRALSGQIARRRSTDLIWISAVAIVGAFIGAKLG